MANKNTSAVVQTNLKTVKTVMEGLNCYEILKVSPAAPSEEIQEAFHREATLYHPDQYSTSSEEDRFLASEIYAKIVEAYKTLTNPKKRRNHDLELKQRESKDLTDPHFEKDDDSDPNLVTVVKEKPTGPRVTAGARFFQLAEKAYSTKDLTSAKMNIEIALNTDPTNPQYLHLRHRIQADLNHLKKK